MNTSHNIYSSNEYFPNKIIKKQNYQAYIIKQKPASSNKTLNNISSDNVRKTYKSLNETQKFNKSGIVKQSFNHILYQNKNWTEKKKYPVIEIEKEEPIEPIITFRTVEKIKKLPKKKLTLPNFIRKRDAARKKKKINIKINDYEDNNVNEYDNKKYFKGNNLTENSSIIEEKIVKKIIIRKEELFDRGNKKISSVSKGKRYRKKPIKVFIEL